jgi:ubiquinone/menaquinone biosynthesis C-methylase UbiE
MPVDQATIQRMTRNEADMAFKKRVQTIFDWIDTDSAPFVLDIPCGRGFYLNMFRYAAPQARIVGAELEWDVIRKAQANIGHLNIPLHNANIYHLPYPDESFDAVILSEILEHIEDDQAALQEVYRVLKPKGVVVITVPNANYPFWWDPINKTLERLFKTHIQRGMLAGIWANHVRLYTMPDLRKAVQGAGFAIEAERRFTHHSFPFIHNLVYGIGMPLLERGALPQNMASAANRLTFEQNDGKWWNPINVGLRVFNFFDRKNTINEAPERSTVNLAMKGRKPNDG